MDWLNAAEDDLQTARILFEQKVYYASAFYCQQAAEKALKAVYINRIKKANISHNLISTAMELKTPQQILSACKRLNPHYIQSRYPDAGNAVPKEAYEAGTVEELLKKAEEVFEWSEKQSK